MTKSMHILIFILFEILRAKLILDCKNGNEFQDWIVLSPKSQPYIYNSNGQVIFGGEDKFDQNTQIQRIVTLIPEHQLIQLSFQMIVWDSSNIIFGNQIEVQIDDQVSLKRLQMNNRVQNFQFTFYFTHRSISALINIEPKAYFEWGLSYFSLQVNEFSSLNEQYIITGFDYKLISQQFTENEGWQDFQNLQIIYPCTNFGILVLRNQENIFTNAFLTPEFDFISIYFKVFSLNDLGSVTLTLEDYEYNYPFSVLNYKFSCSDTNLNNLNLYPVALKFITLPTTQKKNNRIQITISTTGILGIRDFEIFYYKSDTYLPLIVGCKEIVNQQCIFCLEGWNDLNYKQNCIPICGNGIIQYYEECDDGNNIPFDGCYKCKFQCSQDCDQCVFGICIQYKTFEVQIYSLEKHNNPLICNLDILQKQRDYNCGDGIFQILEECDDKNNFLYDGCFQCKSSCPLNCQLCVTGVCYQCKNGYQLVKNNCQPICGDSIQQNEEFCDDGNIVQFDGCFDCQYQCKTGCFKCIESYCIQCMEGWNLNHGECEQLCGDNQIAILSPEQCDNLTQSCIDCQFKCSPYCIKCESQTKCTECLDKILLINGVCITFCGDGLITDNEQCDDSNNLPDDGCFNCQFECQLGCIECNSIDSCNLCDSQYFYLDVITSKCVLFQQTEIQNEFDTYSNNNNDTNNTNSIINDTITTALNLSIILQNQSLNFNENTLKLSQIICKENQIFIDGVCISLCGNGILDLQYEECDDGNQYSGDGCSEICFIEESFECINVENSLSQCTFLAKPNFILSLISDKQSAKQIVEISFTQNIKLLTQVYIEDIIDLQITPQVQYIVQIISITNASLELRDVKYQLSIEFQQSVTSPRLDVQIMRSNLVSEYELELKQFKQTISLGNPFVLSNQTQNQVNSFLQMNNAMMYSMVSISGLSLLTGSPTMFFNMLDLLQQLSYLRFMKFSFPDHLKQFLGQFSKISLKPLLDQLEIDKQIAKLNGGVIPFQSKSKQTKTSTSINTLNQYYLINAKGCFISLLVSFLSYMACSFIIRDQSQRYIIDKFILERKFSQQTTLKLFILNQSIRKSCYQIKTGYFFSGMFQVYFAILHQFAFSCLLQFPSYQFDNVLNSLNSIIALGALFLMLIVCFKSFGVLSILNRSNRQWKYFFSENKIDYWSVHLKSIQMLKIISYMFIIVFCIDFPEIQSYLLSMQSFFYLIFLYRHKPMRQNLDQMKVILRELLSLIITGSFVIYSFDLNEQQMLLYGWIHIYMFVALMANQLVLDFIKQVKDLYWAYQKAMRIEQIRQEAMYYNNPLQKFIMIEHQNHKTFFAK